MIKSIFSTMPMFVCLFWGLYLAASYNSLNRARKYMMLFMFVCCALFFCLCAFFNNQTEVLFVTESVYLYLYLSVSPLFYLYLSALTNLKPIRFPLFWLFVPTIFFPSLSLFIVQGKEILSDIVSAVFILQGVFLIIAGTRMVSIYNVCINEYYSNTEGKEVRYLQVFLLLFLFTALLTLAVILLGRHFFVSRYIYIIPSVLFSFLLFMLGLFCSKRTFTIVDFCREIEESDNKLDLDDKQKDIDESSKLGYQIVQVITSEKLYLHPDLKVSDLAKIMNTNRTYIYQALKRDLNTNFSELINKYRVKCAENIIDRQAEKGTINISEIIEKSGFASESSFYRIIKKHTGSSPQKLFLARTQNKVNKDR